MIKCPPKAEVESHGISLEHHDCLEFFWEFDVCSCMLMREILEIKSPGENKRNRGNHGIINIISWLPRNPLFHEGRLITK